MLEASVTPLLSALDDEDDKTRANAAGALGNLVRNSSKLCEGLVRSGVGRRLMKLAREEKCDAPRRIALFSLGTLSVYRVCRKELMRGGEVEELVGELLRVCKDKTSLKFVERIKVKLGVELNHQKMKN